MSRFEASILSLFSAIATLALMDFTRVLFTNGNHVSAVASFIITIVMGFLCLGYAVIAIRGYD